MVILWVSPRIYFHVLVMLLNHIWICSGSLFACVCVFVFLGGEVGCLGYFGCLELVGLSTIRQVPILWWSLQHVG